MKRFLLAVLMVVVMAGSALATASSVTCTKYVPAYTDERHSNVAVLTVTWTADSGNASVTSTNILALSDCQYTRGYITRIVTNPGATGPTDDLTDVTLLDADGVDVTGGALQNRDNTDSEIAYCLAPDGATIVYPYVVDTLTLAVANNAVNSAVQAVVIYIEMD